jgi:hypothetical protein
MATAPPPTPWKKGAHPEYTAFVMEVHVCRDAEGNVHSARKLQDEDDEVAVQSLGNSQGMEEGSFGLLIEATRQEVMLQTLLKISNDEEFKENLLSETEITDDLREQVTQDTLKLLWATLSRVGPSIVRETLDQVKDGIRAQS